MENVKKLNIEGKCWSWEFESEPNVVYFTNDSGDGIFNQKTVRETNQANECDVKQITGTGQFNLSGYTKDGARRKLNKYFNN